MEIQKENHLLKQFEKTITFKRFFSTLLRFDEDLDCFIATEKWRDKEAELLSAAWWMFAEVAKAQVAPEGFVLIPTIFPESKAQIFAEQEVEAMSKRIDDKFRGGLEFSDEKKAHLIRMNASERRQIFRDFFKMMSDLELLNDSP
jgi:hypothetical protein